MHTVEIDLRDQSAVATVTADLAGSIDGTAFSTPDSWSRARVAGRCWENRSSSCRRRWMRVVSGREDILAG